MVVGSLAALISGCGVPQSNLRFDESYPVNSKISEGSCYDSAVVLGADINRSREIAKRVLIGLDSHIDIDTAERIEAQRNRHIGVFVGSGGEEIKIDLKSIAPDKTYLTVATLTGFVGGAGQKAWSCEVIDQMISMVKRG